MKLGTNFFRSETASHMMVRQVIMVATVLGACFALLVIDSGKNSDVTIDGEINIAELSTLTPMPYVSAIDAMTTNWFCPGVPANDESILSDLVISNASETDISATVTLLSTDQTPVVSALSIPARSHITLDARGGISAQFVSAVVEIIGSQGSVEQIVRHPAGDAVVLCANHPETDWYFADGFTGADSIEQIVMTNPYVDATVVDITFVTADAERSPEQLQGFVLPANSVVALSMDKQGARNEQILAVSIHASSGRLVAGRVQHYLGQGRLGYSMSLGAHAMSTQWWFSNGEKIAGNTESLVIYNPSSRDRSLSIVFMNGSDSANSIDPLLITAPAHRVTTVDTGSIPSLPGGRYGIIVSTNDKDLGDSLGVVVEQVINRRDGNRVGTSVVLGAPHNSGSTTWNVPSGITAGDDVLQVMNTTSQEATVSVLQVGPAGAVVLGGLESLVLQAGGVLSIGVPPGLPDAQIIVQATATVVVQRLLLRGHGLFGRSAVLALPHLPSPQPVESSP
ncbi:MAG: hypothetical protein ABR76_00040 [Acidimicrobiia bacterium BACL6 MAG-121220-bin61]|uniref:IgGFc-binding protein N-terminal domain-containing protein n=1 Tax=Acidimicrobiia bacterium BACL6 MAG-120924-bin43 TaxID=1655583 RepID=A0A0R2QG30_9ACTN|nr:MAG: hypothetical protein ABR75_07065 [Acidimicrobiia bacterium BACL6 MAG-120924-bin43]KRO53371.1 MAG: hypothetical protein ABR78_09390 [Acidimicrobiia bacterium BACL6 MAG-120910-bin40]KRO66003.1 MAG: hypothetical protein ABR76_00040 [Acidimicrobiia bacterium BACL6 MAG-121220-bin61]